MEDLHNYNSLFSKLNKNQIIELIKYINDFELDYFSKVNLPSNLHFGIEIEVEKAYNHKVFEYMEKKYNANFIDDTANTKNIDYKKWHTSYDGSLDLGIELTSPILTDQKSTWLEIKNICDMLTKYSAKATDNTGAHIHFNTSFLKGDYNNFIRLFKLYTIYENILIKFGYGQINKPRKNLFKYAKPTSRELYASLNYLNNCSDLYEIMIFAPYEKHRSMNLKNINWRNINSEAKNTIEFRSPNGTIDYIIWQNLVNTYGHFLLAANNSNIDDEFLDYKINNYYLENHQNNNFYQEIYIREALELVDMIFDNNYDKIMFLKYYINNVEICNMNKTKTICKK